MCAGCSSKSNPDLPLRWNWPWTSQNGSWARLSDADFSAGGDLPETVGDIVAFYAAVRTE